MSDNIYVILKMDKLVTLQQWQQAVADNGFALKLDNSFDPDKKQGLLQCSYQETKTPFEYSAAPLEQDWLNKAGIQRAGDRDSLVRFTDLQPSILPTLEGYYSWVASLIAASVLASLADGLLIHDLREPLVEGDKSIAFAHSEEAAILLFCYEMNFPTGLSIAGRIFPMTIIQSPSYQELVAREAGILAEIFKTGKPGDAQNAELEAIEKEVRRLVEEGSG